MAGSLRAFKAICVWLCTRHAVRTPTLVTLVVLVTLVSFDVAIAFAQSERMARDPRAEPPVEPMSLGEVVARFFPDYVPVDVSRTISLPFEGERTERIPTARGVCYGVGAFSAEIEDLDIWVYEQDVLVAQDVLGDPYPVVRWCAQRGGIVRLRFVAFAGEGDLSFQVLEHPESRAAATGEQDELSNRLTRAAARSAPNWIVVGGQWRGRYDGVGSRDATFSARAGQCYAALAVGEVSLNDIDLVVLDAADEVLAQDIAVDATPAVVVCPPFDTTLTARVIVVSGFGTVALQWYARVLAPTVMPRPPARNP